MEYLLLCILYFHDGTQRRIEYGPFETLDELVAQMDAHMYVSLNFFKGRERGTSCFCVDCPQE